MIGQDGELKGACAERLLQVLLPLMRQLSVEAEAAGADGLTIAQFRLLAALARRDYTAGDLAAHLGVAASTISGLVTPLARRGLVERRQDEHDRRQIFLSVTSDGRDVHACIKARAQRFLAGVCGELSEESMRALLRGLSGLNHVLHQQRAPAAPRSDLDVLLEESR